MKPVRTGSKIKQSVLSCADVPQDFQFDQFFYHTDDGKEICKIKKASARCALRAEIIGSTH